MRWITFDKKVVGPWVCSRLGCHWEPELSVAFGQVQDGMLVGGSFIDQCNGHSAMIHVAGASSRWLSKLYLQVVFDYAFNQLEVTKLIGPVPASNKHAFDFDLRLGFTQEAVVTKAAPDGSDLLLLTMDREGCKWLRGANLKTVPVWPSHLPIGTYEYGQVEQGSAAA